MEWLWYVIAALGAGIGTGLAGLSAATVMVPILIVLCPSFAGETGTYQATAIALSADILGSAVTTWTYARNGNIDLRRGWLMLVCILSMCTVGSYVAYRVENVVLGSFTLFLTFCIGIRFLIRPDSSRQDQAEKGESLDWKGIIISVFFGTTIGFGTGFVGTGGGMMMLVVFTLFLKMGLKTAVGTSTFIMTFTALIAAVSHILVHPAIVFEKWPVLVLGMVVATTSSLVTARFANRVENRTIGLVTGGVLTVLGAFMLLLYFREPLSQMELLRQVAHCAGVLATYLFFAILIVFSIRFLIKPPSFVFRKCLHVIAFTCISLMIPAAQSWKAAALTALIIAVVVYPVLSLLEHEVWFAQLFVQKSPGEIKRSMGMLFLMFAGLIAVVWGLFNQPVLAVAAILMWGTGDAAAALVGIPLGKHKVQSRLTDGRKSWEGSCAMLAVSLLSGCLVLCSMQRLSIREVLLPVAVSALLGTATELVTPSEYDTVTVPAVIAASLLIFTCI